MFGSFDPQDLYGSCGHIGQPSENLSNLMRSMLYYNAHLCVIISKFVSFVFTPKTTLFKMFYQRTLLKVPDYTVSYTFDFFLMQQAGKNSTPTVIQCLCNHFTSFGGSFLVQPNKMDFSQVQVGFRTINDLYDVLVLVSVLLVFLVYLISLIFARRADKRDLEKVNLEDNWRT